MPTNFKEFERDVRHFAEIVLPDEFKRFQRKIAFELLSRVVLKTPVDTGRARGNWQVAVDFIKENELETQDPNGQQTISDGLAVLDELRGEGEQVVYISNNVPYITALEDGHSNRAPNGMLALSLSEIETIFAA